MKNDVCAELEKAQGKKTVSGFLKSRKKRCKILFNVRLGVTGEEIDVLKAALVAYAKNTAVKTKKEVAEDLLDLIKYQEEKQQSK